MTEQDETQEFKVNLNATITVEAKNREEAQGKALERCYNDPDELQITGGEAVPLYPDKDFYLADVREVGSSKASTGYELIKDKSALRVLFSTTTAMSRDLVGDGAPAMKYNLSAFLMATVDGVDWDNFKELVDQIKTQAHEMAEEGVDDNPWGLLAGTEFVVEDRMDEVNDDYRIDLEPEEAGEDDDRE